MDFLNLCASIKALIAKGHTYLDGLVISKVIELAESSDSIVKNELQRRVLLQHLHTLQQYGLFDQDADDADSTFASSKASLLEAMVEPDVVDARLFVLVEAGASGTTTRAFLSRTGAESALIQAALQYRNSAGPIHTEESLEAATTRMRDAASRGEHPVVKCGDQGALWIDTIELEA